MRNKVLYCVIIILACLAPYMGYCANIGTQEISFTTPNSDRVLVAEIYYPTAGKTNTQLVDHGIWQRRAFVKGAELSSHSALYPLVIFSHGFQGDRFGNSWLAERLVSKGFIVAMIDHTHNTSYDHSDLFAYTSMWRRPLDISYLLTYILKHPKWGKSIDTNSIAAAGFSLGGLTTLWLGGAEADRTLFKEIMDQNYSRWSDWPQHEREKAAAVDWKLASRSYYDPRIKAVVAISPDLGRGFTAQGLKQMKVPTLIIVGDKDTVTLAKDNAEFYASYIPKSKIIIVKGSGHFSFMNKCSNLGNRIVPQLCNDAIDRDKMHKEISGQIIEFLSNAWSQVK